jgi:peptide/nickel transport system permease protein
VARFVIERIVSSVVMGVALTLLVFLAFFRLAQEDSAGRRRSPEAFRIHGSALGQYVHWLWRLVAHGDLGRSYVTREPVGTRLMQAAPVTLSLVVGGLVVWLALSLSLGALAALRPRSPGDRASTVFVLAGLSLHPAWLGLVVSWFFGHYTHVLPAQGYCSIDNLSTGCAGLGHWASHLLMPWLVFGFVNAALFTSMLRALLREELGADYVRTAVAKGLPPGRVVRRHVLRNVSAPLLTMVGLTAGTSLAGVIFIESAFDLPGLGSMLRQAALRHDLPMTAGSVLMLAAAVVVLNLLVDLGYALLDPRVSAA